MYIVRLIQGGLALVGALLLTVLCTQLTLNGVLLNNDSENASARTGPLKSESRKLENYSSIENDGPFQIAWSPGKEPQAVVEAPENMLPHVKTEIINGRLKISSDASSFSSIRVRVTLHGPQLDSIVLLGSGSLSAIGLNSTNLSILLSGSSDILVSGESNNLNVTIAGSGNLNAEDLKARSALVTINGSGNAIVNSSSALQAFVNGSGNVSYLGTPIKISQNISGSGRIVAK